jgi:hypothetical protein
MSKIDSMGGKSHYNPFAEQWRAKNKKAHAAYARKDALAKKIAKVGQGKSHISGNIYE